MSISAQLRSKHQQMYVKRAGGTNRLRIKVHGVSCPLPVLSHNYSTIQYLQLCSSLNLTLKHACYSNQRFNLHFVRCQASIAVLNKYMPSNITFASAVCLQAITANAKMQMVNTMGSPSCVATNKVDSLAVYTTLVRIIRCVR